MNRRFFCKITAQDRKQMLALSKMDVDLFRSTLRVIPKKEHTVDGLLTLEEVASLVDQGYQVLVEESATKRARAQDSITSAEEWIKEFERR